MLFIKNNTPKVGSLVGNMVTTPQASSRSDDDELSILPSTPSTPSRPTPATPSGGYNSNAPITAQVVAAQRVRTTGISCKF